MTSPFYFQSNSQIHPIFSIPNISIPHQHHLLPGLMQELANWSPWFQVSPFNQSIPLTIARVFFLICRSDHVSSQRKPLSGFQQHRVLNMTNRNLCDVVLVYLFISNLKFSNLQNFFHFVWSYAFFISSFMYSQPGTLFPILPFIIITPTLPGDLNLDIISSQIFLISWITFTWVSAKLFSAL